jgi:hypothetical protein
MAKPTKYAVLICTIVTVVAVIGIIVGLLASKPLVTILMLLPAVVYEVYRTEGKSTKWAAWVLLAVFVVEVIFIAANVSLDLGSVLGTSEETVAGYRVPLGDAKVVGPTVMAVLSIVLLVRTRGRYTKWLAVTIFVTSLAVVYALDSTVFGRLFRIGVEEGLRRIQ